MKRSGELLATLLLSLLAPLAAVPCPAQTAQPEPAMNTISGTVTAVGYAVGGGSTYVDMMGTPNAASASGDAKVEAKTGGTLITLKVVGMPQPITMGTEFLTYVLWTVTPEGTTRNLGELRIDKLGAGQLQARAQSQTFALIVTAEPYYAVSIPSEIIVLQNQPRKNTRGKFFPDNSYRLMKRSEYAKLGNPLALTLDLKKTPLDMYEARNALDIAKSRGAEQYAPTAFAKAQSSLQSAENVLAAGSSKNKVISAARQTVQFAEDARALAAQRIEAERIQNEKDAAASAAAAQAKAEADAQAAREAQRQAELSAAKEAQLKAQNEAQAAQAQAAAAQAQADAARAAAQSAAEQAALRAKEEAARDEAARAKAATETLRALLLQQLNDVLQTTDTVRGLVVNMADVLFETNKYALSSDAKLKLAKLTGIIQAHPGLNLAVEGHTDTTGTADYNMTLSQQRADSVRQFVIAQGLSPDIITSTGLGEANPVADNSTAAGRKKNRRVEIIVSGEVIGVPITTR
jgi:outer membrane protein OmpA-like peptidoglycan-associated protein